MKNMKRILLTMVAALLLVVMSVGGTLAYLQSTSEKVENTFTVGKIKITLDEADVNEEGVAIEGADRVLTNEYKLMPGHTYVKDPTVHVQPDSEESYIRIKVTINKIAELKAIFGDDFLPQYFVKGWDNSIWNTTGVITENADGTNTYEFWYYKTVSTEDQDTVLDLEPLFTDIVIPGDVTNTEINTLEGLKIDIIAHAIQKDTFNSAADAWKAWDDTQVDPKPAATTNP